MITESQIIASEGYLHVLLSLVLAGALSFLHPLAGVTGFVVFCFCLYFFRNPTRLIPVGEHLVVSPADGKIIFVGKANEFHFLQKEMQKVSIFMSPLDVHVNRAPVAGVVVNKKYQRGCFKAAFNDESSTGNEQLALHVKTDAGEDVVFVQIAGWLARRIVCYPQVNDRLGCGEIFGMIKFGSRMDIYFPENFSVNVQLNEKAKAGQSLLAKRMGGSP